MINEMIVIPHKFLHQIILLSCMLSLSIKEPIYKHRKLAFVWLIRHDLKQEIIF